jgi:hypothetical protein
MIQKYSTVSGQVPTVAPSNDHTDGTWSVTDVYAGELMANVNNSRLWMRMSNGIREILISKDNSANGDLYFYNNSAWQKLAIGSSGQVLTVSGGVPIWGTSSGGGGGSGTVTSVSALTLGTTGTDLSSSVANPNTTPVITLNVPTASASNRGVLSSADWSAFNNKQAALGFTPEDVANKQTNLAASATKYPTVDAVNAGFDNKQDKRIVVSTNTTAVIDGAYTLVANATFSDPTPQEGKGFSVLLRNGIATIGGTPYSTAGTTVWRIYHSGAWANYVNQLALGFTPEDVANKQTNLAANATKYPTVDAVNTGINNSGAYIFLSINFN